MSFQRGISEAVTGIVGSIIFGIILSSFAEDGLIPSNMVFLFSFAGFISSIGLMYSFKTAGALFILGWVFGAWFLKDMLSTFDFVVYFIAPILALGIRIVLFIRRTFSG